MASRRRQQTDRPDTADSGLEDDALTCSAGDLRSLGEPEGDLRSLGEPEGDLKSLGEVDGDFRSLGEVDHDLRSLDEVDRDLRSLKVDGDRDNDLRACRDLGEVGSDVELTASGRGLLEVPAHSAAFTAQLRQFLRAVRSPQQRRRAPRSGSLAESPLDGSGGGSGSPVEGRPDASELEFDWWAGQFSICGAEFADVDLFAWCLETNRKVGGSSVTHFLAVFSC